MGCERKAPPTDDVTVFAAASTARAMEAIARRFEQGTDRRMRVSAAASSTLAQQIMAGARADVFVSAHPKWIDALEHRGLLRPDTRRVLARNALVLIEPKANRERRTGEERFRADLALAGPFAMGDPDYVPVGDYGREALINMGLWREIEPRLLRASDAPAALRLVELGEATAGLVYASDAAGSDKVSVISPIPPGTHRPIEIVAALTRDAGGAADEAYALLFSKAGAAAFAAAGFEPVDALHE